VWRHEANIRKLLKGTESKLGQKAAGAAPPQGSSKKHPHGEGYQARGHSHHHTKNQAKKKGK